MAARGAVRECPPQNSWRKPMFSSFSDPFEALFALQRALDARTASDWMGRGTAASGSFPPINIFQKGEDFVALVELPGLDKSEPEIDTIVNFNLVSGKKTTV